MFNILFFNMKGFLMNRRLNIVFSLLLSGMMVSLCFGKTMHAKAAVAASSAPKDGLIQVNDHWITHNDIDKAIKSFRMQMAKSNPSQALPDTFPPEMMQSFYMQMVDNELLTQETAKRHISADNKKVDSIYTKMKEQYPDSAAMQKMLADMGQTEKTVREQIGKALAIDSLVRSVYSTLDSVNDSTCRAFYTANPSYFTMPARYKASQIILKTTNNMTPEQKKILTDKADKILAELKAGKAFSAAVKQYSEDPKAATDSGDIGWFKLGDIRPEFDSAVVKLSVDGISPVFETDIGLHIIKKTGEEAGTTVAYADVHDKILYALTREKLGQALQDFIAKLRAVAKITYKNPADKPQQ
jgi:parvulin-like peptidyl-prolyl isomerase